MRRVVVVRTSRTAGGGCCSGDVPLFDDGGTAHRHRTGENGSLYRALRDGLPPDVDVEVVAPTNWVWLVPELVRGGRRAGLTGRELARSVRAGLRSPSLLVDGVPVTSGGLPTSDSALEAVAGVDERLRRSSVPS